MNRYAYKGKNPHGEPKKTLAEMASDLGMTTASLRAFLGHADEPKPKPVLKFSGGSRGSAKIYYSPSEFMAWWKALAEKKNGP